MSISIVPIFASISTPGRASVGDIFVPTKLPARVMAAVMRWNITELPASS